MAQIYIGLILDCKVIYPSPNCLQKAKHIFSGKADNII